MIHTIVLLCLRLGPACVLTLRLHHCPGHRRLVHERRRHIVVWALVVLISVQTFIIGLHAVERVA